MNNYKIIKKIGEGTFSEVVKVRNQTDGKCYACKIMKQPLDSLEQANSLREVQAMRRLSLHPNIIQLHEILFDKATGILSLICELMEMNIYELIRGRQHPLPENKVRHYMYQLCKSLDHMHRKGIFHRDVKPENILIKQDVLKLADFGSCRSMYSKPPHTEYISTRWYRAPECLLTDGYYSHKMDMWSAGCVFFEIMSLSPLFPGTNELDQVAKIHEVLGTPNPALLEKFKRSRSMQFDFPKQEGCGLTPLIPHCSPPSMSLLYQMLEYDPEQRISAEATLHHTCFHEQRLAERRAANLRRAVGTMEIGEAGGTGNPVDHLWRIARQANGQPQGRHMANPLRRNMPHKLSAMMPVAKISTFPLTSLPPLGITHRGSLPTLAPKKCHSHLSKQTGEEPHHQEFKGYHLPPIERKHGGF